MIFICHVTLQEHVIRALCDFMDPSGKSPSCIVWWQQTLWQWRYDFKYRDLEKSRDQRVIRFNEQEPIKVSYHPAKLGSHRHCGSRDMFLVVQGQYSTRFSPPLIFISKAHGMPCLHTRKVKTQTQQLVGVSNEVLLILVIHVYKNN